MQNENNEPTQATFKVTEIGNLNYSDFMESDASKSKPVVHWTRPERLRITVNLPGVFTASHIATKFTDNTLLITAGPHTLSIPLPYPVSEESAKAKFLKESSRLEIELKTLTI